jgi:type I restriction enzyme S subunit
MGDWRTSTWGDEISLEYGKALRGYDATGGKYRVFGSNGPIGWTAKPLANGPGVILGRKGAYRGIEFSREPFFVIDTAYYVVPKTELDMRWLYYAIRYHKLGEIDDGSPIPSTTRSAVYVRDLDVPPLAEQKGIAAALGAPDDKIELNWRMNATLEAMASALFANWIQSHDNQIEERFVQELIDEGILLIGDGYRAKNSEFAMDGLPFIRAGNLKADGLDLAGAEVLSARSVAAAGHKVGKVGDVSFTSKGTVGRITRVSSKTGVFVYSPQVCFWRSLAHDKLNSNVLYRWMRSGDFTRQVAAVSTQTDMAPYVSLQDQRKMIVQLPPPSAQREIARQLAPIDERIAANDQESRTLAAMRDTLLPKLLSGAVRTANLRDNQTR